jgi:hypothetical protein
MQRIVTLGVLCVLMLVAGCGASMLQQSPEATPDATAQFGAAPDGVDAAVWNELTSRLASELALAKVATVVQLPETADALVSDFALDSVNGDILTFGWSFRNPGDYDQNGEVNAADLVPIAANFRAKDGGANWVAAQIADGNGDGEVNGSDVTEISRHWQRAVRGYVFCVEFGDYTRDNEINISDLTTIGPCKLDNYPVYGAVNMTAWPGVRASDSDPCQCWWGFSMPGTETGTVPAAGGPKEFTLSYKWANQAGSLYFCAMPFYTMEQLSGLVADTSVIALGPESNNLLVQKPVLP